MSTMNAEAGCPGRPTTGVDPAPPDDGGFAGSNGDAVDQDLSQFPDNCRYHIAVIFGTASGDQDSIAFRGCLADRELKRFPVIPGNAIEYGKAPPVPTNAATTYEFTSLTCPAGGPDSSPAPVRCRSRGSRSSAFGQRGRHCILQRQARRYPVVKVVFPCCIRLPLFEKSSLKKNVLPESDGFLTRISPPICSACSIITTASAPAEDPLR